MSEETRPDWKFDELPFHEFCAHCKQRFDETILEPTVTIVETDTKHALYSFCDEECLEAWSTDDL